MRSRILVGLAVGCSPISSAAFHAGQVEHPWTRRHQAPVDRHRRHRRRVLSVRRRHRQGAQREPPGVEATAEVTAASVDNLKFLKQGTSDIAFTMADTAQDGVAGRDVFEDFGPCRSARWPCSIRATCTW